MEVGVNAMSWPHGSSLQVQATLDHREKIWLNGTLEGPCLQTTAGYMNGTGSIIHSTEHNNTTNIKTVHKQKDVCAAPDLCEDLTSVVCVAANHGLRVDVQRREACSKSETLGSLSLGTTNQRLTLRARGCLDSLAAVEVPLMAPKNSKH